MTGELLDHERREKGEKRETAAFLSRHSRYFVTFVVQNFIDSPGQ